MTQHFSSEIFYLSWLILLTELQKQKKFNISEDLDSSNSIDETEIQRKFLWQMHFFKSILIFISVYKPKLYDKKCDLTSNVKKLWGKWKHFFGKIVFIWFWPPGDWQSDISSEMFSRIFFYLILFFTLSFVRLIVVKRRFVKGNVFTYQKREVVCVAWDEKTCI